MRRQLKPVAATDDGEGVEAALADSPAVSRRPTRKRTLAVALAVACAAIALAVLSSLGGGASERRATAAANPASSAVPAAAAAPGAEAPATPRLKSHPQVVVAVRPGEAPPVPLTTSNSRPPSDAEVRAELSGFRKYLATYGGPRGKVPSIRPDGTAVAPFNAPAVVATVISAANAIASTPYKWGGGHGAWQDNGYDCSGSVSFALAGAGLLQSPLTSGMFMSWGDPGPGRWITIYANNGHVFMVVAGLRYDTSGANGGTRWQSAAARSYAGFTQVHPPGL
jgi:cell wall-associated NlpC family hydrolase